MDDADAVDVTAIASLNSYVYKFVKGILVKVFLLLSLYLLVQVAKRKLKG